MNRDKDERAIRELFNRMSAAWNKGDGRAFAACFTEDVDYITFFGQHLKGREAVAVAHQQLFDGIMKGSTLSGADGITRMRFLTPDVAVVHAVGSIKMRWQVRPSKRRASINTNILVKDDHGAWLISAFQNTRIKHRFVERYSREIDRRNPGAVISDRPSQISRRR